LSAAGQTWALAALDDAVAAQPDERIKGKTIIRFIREDSGMFNAHEGESRTEGSLMSTRLSRPFLSPHIGATENPSKQMSTEVPLNETGVEFDAERMIES